MVIVKTAQPPAVVDVVKMSDGLYYKVTSVDFEKRSICVTDYETGNDKTFNSSEIITINGNELSQEAGIKADSGNKYKNAFEELAYEIFWRTERELREASPLYAGLAKAKTALITAVMNNKINISEIRAKAEEQAKRETAFKHIEKEHEARNRKERIKNND